MTDYISRADAIEMAVDVETPQGTYERAIYVDDLMALPSADAILTKIQIDDIDKAKASSQLLDDLAVDMVNAMGKRIVEVVYCKDCRHYAKGHCYMYGGQMNDDDYCSRAERREP